MAKAGLTRDLVVDAAARLADEAGFDAVTPSALAKRLGVQPASLYEHVANGLDLRQAVARLALDRLADRAADAVAGRSGKDALAALANTHRDFAREHPGQFAASRFPLAAGEIEGSGGWRLSRLMRAMLRGYALPEAAETHAIRLLGSYFLGFSVLELSGSFARSTPDPEQSWIATLDALDLLLRNWSGTSHVG